MTRLDKVRFRKTKKGDPTTKVCFVIVPGLLHKKYSNRDCHSRKNCKKEVVRRDQKVKRRKKRPMRTKEETYRKKKKGHYDLKESF